MKETRSQILVQEGDVKLGTALFMNLMASAVQWLYLQIIDLKRDMPTLIRFLFKFQFVSK